MTPTVTIDLEFQITCVIAKPHGPRQLLPQAPRFPEEGSKLSPRNPRLNASGYPILIEEEMELKRAWDAGR